MIEIKLDTDPNTLSPEHREKFFLLAACDRGTHLKGVGHRLLDCVWVMESDTDSTIEMPYRGGIAPPNALNIYIPERNKQ